MKLLLLAGEESGVHYARRIASALPGWEVRGYADSGFKTADLAVMGFWAVLKRMRFFLKVKKTMERVVDDWRPDAVCTIDYPGMNLKLSRYARSKGVKTVHVVCPQVWAWKSGRVPSIEASTDVLCCFFPFEPALFKPGFAKFVGHPLAEEFPPPERGAWRKRAALTVALLPGSRIGEIRKNLPAMLDAAGRLEGVEVCIPAANEEALEAIRSVPGAEKAIVTLGGARDVLQRAYAAVVASGTATLESALAGCPTVVVYRVGRFLAWFARRVIKGVKHVGLANIVWEKTGEEGPEPMKELLQENFTADAVAGELRKWFDDPVLRDDASAKLEAIVSRLRTSSSPIEKIAAIIKSSAPGAGRENV